MCIFVLGQVGDLVLELEGGTPGPSWGYSTVNFVHMLSNFGNNFLQNSSKDVLPCPLEYPHEGPDAVPALRKGSQPVVTTGRPVDIIYFTIPSTTLRNLSCYGVGVRYDLLGTGLR